MPPMFPSQAQVQAAAEAPVRRRGALILTKDDFRAAWLNLFLAGNYDQIVDIDLGTPKKQLLGSRSPKLCRYCLKSVPETTTL